MSYIFKIVLIMSLVGGIVSIYLFVLNKIVAKTLSAKWHYTMIKIVILFYILPLPVIVSNVNHFRQSYEASNTYILPMALENTPEAPIDENIDFLETHEASIVYESPVEINVAMNSQSQLSINWDIVILILAILWLVGILFFSTRYLFTYINLKRKILNSSDVVNDGDILDILKLVKQEEGITRNITVMENVKLSTPILIGLFKTNIVVPQNMFTKEQLYLVIKHELIHYKQRDLFFKLLSLFTVSIHWFNPFVYRIQKSLNVWSELNCDEIIISNLNISQIKEYGQILLRPQEVKNKNINTYVVCLAQNTKFLERRIKMLFNKKNKTKTSTILSLTAGLSVMGLGLLINSGFPVEVRANDNNSAINEDGAFGTSIVINEDGTFSTLPTSDELDNIYNFLHNVGAGEYRIVNYRENSPYAFTRSHNMSSFYHSPNVINNPDMDIFRQYVEGAHANILFPSYIPEGFTPARVSTNYGHIDEKFDRDNIQPYSVDYDEFGNALITYSLEFNNEDLTGYGLLLTGSSIEDLDTIEGDEYFGSSGAVISIDYHTYTDLSMRDNMDGWAHNIESGLMEEIKVEGYHRAVFWGGENPKGGNFIHFDGFVEIEPTTFVSTEAFEPQGNINATVEDKWAFVSIVAVGDDVNDIDLDMVIKIAEGLVSTK